MRHSQGIIEPSDAGNIPGTFLIANPDQSKDTHGSGLRKGKGKDQDVVLVPQPSDDPNDPLNWQVREKRLILWTVGVVAALIHAFGPIVATSYLIIGVEFNKSLDNVTQAISGNFALCAGIGTLFTAAFGVCYGKRPAFLISIISLLGLSIWTAFETKFRAIAFSRALQGLATAPAEVLATALVADLYFTHERGFGLAVVGSLHYAATLLSQIAGGFIVEHLIWRVIFLIMASLMLFSAPLIFFLVPETARNRSTPTTNSISKKGTLSLNTFEMSVNAETSKYQAPSCAASKRVPYNRRLRVWSGKLSSESFWRTCLRPIPLVFSPAVLFGIFVHGLGTTWLLAFAFAKLRLFSVPPYNLTPSQVGLTVLPGAASGLLAQFLAGLLSDFLAKSLARRNRGIYESEFRLWLMVPQAIFSFSGFLGFGISIQHGKPLWLVLLFYSMVTFSVPFGSLASLTYLVDSLPDHCPEALVSTVVVKSGFVLLFATFINGWLDRFGVERVFVVLGALNLFISLTTIPFYIWGKVMRMRTHRSPWLQRLL